MVGSDETRSAKPPLFRATLHSTVYDNDTSDFATRELTSRFHSNWSTVGSNMMAIDVAILSGISKSPSCLQIESSLIYWYHQGHRLVKKAFGSSVEQSSSAAYHKAYGLSIFPRSDLVEDAVAAAKGDKQSSMREVLLRSHDSVETWLRTGSYGDVFLSPPERDSELCIAAIHTGASSVSVALLHGASVSHQFGIEAYLVSSSCKNQCAGCEKEVGVLEGVFLLESCDICCSKFCISCSVCLHLLFKKNIM